MLIDNNTNKKFEIKTQHLLCDRFLSFSLPSFLLLTIYANDALHKLREVNFHLHYMLKYLLNLVTRDLSLLCCVSVALISSITLQAPVAVEHKILKITIATF